MSKLLAFLLLLPMWTSSLQAHSRASDPAVVRAVLFYSPGCGHCYLVITETLPALFEQYGNQLYIVGVDVSQPEGQALFVTALQHFNLESGGVPFLVVGDIYLVGSVDIPEKFPGLIELYLAQGGTDWPAIPGLVEALSVVQPDAEPATPTTQTEFTPTAMALEAADSLTPTLQVSATPEAFVPKPTPGLIIAGSYSGNFRDRFTRDLQGNTLAVFVLASMIFSVGGAIPYFRRLPRLRKERPRRSLWSEWLTLALCIIGMIVAGYLAYVETANVEAVCGPVGDCNTVQQSEYARLFGLLPIGILGLFGYSLILVAWLARRYASGRIAVYASLALMMMSAGGLLFSIYLTFLEPFVIGATCAWCLTSAILMTALFWLSLAPGQRALFSLYPPGKALERSRGTG
jgi:uncharacterized membrane protein/thiol-disulfide isomerase/thioredoxin